MDLRRHIGLRVRRARTAANLTQGRLAELVDRAIETISNIERGQALPGIDLLVSIAAATGTPIAVLLEGVGQRKKVNAVRLVKEEEVRFMAEKLSDRDLALALRLLRAIEG